ncbi:MAG: hypothetical protein CMQ77_03680 [Gammaproteobacteria bacterium]|nr:hypothetical protein [Gammaproteobacteria bacterium]|tara:strand:- start:11960 stop:13177 length:1218 start_codon:yes stop_codon:yes gene_type:complete
MRIIYLHQYFKLPSESGGTRSYDLANGFLDLGHQIEIVTSTSDLKYKSGKRWKKIEKNGLLIHYIYLPYTNDLNYFKRLIVFTKFLFSSSLKLLSLKGDLTLATSTPLTIGVPALLKKWIHKTPFIFEVRDVWPEVVIAIGAVKNKIFIRALYILESLIYKNASVIVPLSVDMKKSITSRYPKLTPKIIEVIENISEIDRFQNQHESDKFLIEKKIGFLPRFSILYAGTFGKVNGINYVINLASKTLSLDPSIVYILIGDGAYKKIIIAEAHRKGVINKNVFFLDSVSKSELPQFYFECDIGSSFVIPIKELWSNSANKFFDTIAAGKPILINHNGWQKDIINEENIGYVLPATLSESSIIDFLKYTCDDVLIKKQNENALNFAKKNYSREIALSKYNKIFNKIF